MVRTPAVAVLASLFAWFVASPWLADGPAHSAPVSDPPSAATNVSGAVYDSIGRGPLAGATVQLVGVADTVTGRVHQARTDSAGRYAVAGVAPGTYAVGFGHPKLDSLGLELSARWVQIRGGAQRMDLATPSSATIAGAICPEGTYGDSVAVLIGRLLHTEDRTPFGGAEITAAWTETVIQRNLIRQRDPEVSAVADSAGWFGMCALPSEVPLMVRAGLGTDSTGYVVMELRPGEVRATSFVIGAATRIEIGAEGAPTVAADSAITSLWRGGARLTGTVRDDRGNPVAGAHVSIWSSGRNATTSDRGAFAIDSAPGGTHTLEIRALGFVPAQRTVHLSPMEDAAIHVALGERTTTLPTVAIRGRLLYSRHLTQFEARRRSSPFGQFFTSDKLENLPRMKLSSLMMQASGVTVTGGPKPQIVMRRGSGYCMPTFYVDGVRTFMNTDEMDAWFRSDDLAGVEVYPRTALVPVEYQGLLTGCGVIGLWTRPPGVKPKKD